MLCFTRENAPRIRNWNLRRPSTSFRSRRALHHERFISHGKLVLVSPWSLFAPHDTICFSEIDTPKDTERQKDSPHTGRRARRRRRRRRLVRQKGQRVDDTLRALLLQFSPHHTQVVSSLRASSIPTKSAFVPVVTSPSITSRFFDRRRGGRGSQRVTGFFATGRISGAHISDRISNQAGSRDSGSPERYVDRHRFVTSLRVRSSQTLDT